MKILLAASGYPPDVEGEIELAVQALARSLAARGHAVAVAAGARAAASSACVSSTCDGAVAVHRIQRSDEHAGHWQKSASTAARHLFRAIVKSERPDVVHVHHWQRLTRDLVHCAALEGVPSIVTLHYRWTTCLIGTRVKPDTRAACEAELGASPCLACAQRVPPKTPWVPIEAQHMALAERGRDLVRELALARALLVPSAAHADLVRRFWPALVAGRELSVLAPSSPHEPRDSGELAAGARSGIDALVELYAFATAQGPPPLAAPGASDWYSARMREFAESEWDKNLARCTPRELGLPEA